jgi:hypothetical protein
VICAADSPLACVIFVVQDRDESSKIAWTPVINKVAAGGDCKANT